VSKSADGRDIILTLNGPYPTERGMPAGQDRIVLGSGVSSPNQGIEEVRFADGTVWDRNKLLSLASLPGPGDDAIYGDSQANTLYGLAGFDWLQGNGGADAYLFNRGDGIDTIFDNGPSAEIDTVQLGYGIGAADVAVTHGRNARDIVLSVVGTADQLILRDRLVTGSGGADQIRFWDGTVWTYATLVQKLGTGGAGNDLVFGDPGSGTLAGGAGDDRLYGSSGNDTYVYNVGDGNDRVHEDSDYTGVPTGWSSAPA
jgi:Ca2+-binding RTX toxin-like protein